MKQTILYERHVRLGAKIAPFGGYLMPIQYSGIMKEHAATRESATLFDTCHMGEFKIYGSTALKDLEKLLSCPVSSMKIGQCRYGFICNEKGGVIDDQIIYRMGENEFYMVVNASTEEQDYKWIVLHLSEGTSTENLSAQTAKLDLQGPASPKIMQKIMERSIDSMKFYHFEYNSYRGIKVLTSRTGYTGEIGFEIYCPNQCAGELWDEILSLGAQPAGLGARDTLRLEMGYPLYGHELDENTNAGNSGFKRSIAEDKDFIGAAAIRNESGKQVLAGIEVEGRRAARHGDSIEDSTGATVGKVTSGSFSPSLQNALALGYISSSHASLGTPLVIRTDRSTLNCKVVELPFYKKGTARESIGKFLN